jgi:hypothetical protein
MRRASPRPNVESAHSEPATSRTRPLARRTGPPPGMHAAVERARGGARFDAGSETTGLTRRLGLARHVLTHIYPGRRREARLTPGYHSTAASRLKKNRAQPPVRKLRSHASQRLHERLTLFRRSQTGVRWQPRHRSRQRSGEATEARTLVQVELPRKIPGWAVPGALRLGGTSTGNVKVSPIPSVDRWRARRSFLGRA